MTEHDTAGGAGRESEVFERGVLRKVLLRIMPFSFLVFVISFLDRANISYAALTMGRDLGLGSEAFGFAAGVFFLGYLFLEVPSNLALRRFGARAVLSRIQISWGIVACASAFVQNAHQLYLARFLLGLAEAGLIPGLVAYFNYWFPVRYLARTGALLGAAVPLAYMISGPLSTWIMDHVRLFGLSGWRSMLFLEGLPAIITGLLTYAVFSERPADARWLNDRERVWLASATDQDVTGGATAELSTLRTLLNPRILYLGLIYLLFQFGNFGIGFWMPQLLRTTGGGLTTAEVGWYSAIPYAVATAGLYLWSRSSDRAGERRVHAAIALVLAGTALGASALSRELVPSLVLLSLCLTGFYAFKAPFNVLPRLFLRRETAVVAFAVINSVGNIGSFSGPYVFGLIKGHTQGPLPGLLTLAGCTLLAAVMTFGLRFAGPTAASTVSHGTGLRTPTADA